MGVYITTEVKFCCVRAVLVKLDFIAEIMCNSVIPTKQTINKLWAGWVN